MVSTPPRCPILIISFTLCLMGLIDGCPTNSSILIKKLVENRKRVWKGQNEKTPPPWQSLVNDKLGGYMYALHHGVPTPKVYACSRGFPHISPEAWGTNSFVMKPLNGFNSIGVVVSDNGIDMMSKLPVTNENVETIYKLHTTKSTMSREMIFSPSTDFMVEEYLRPKGEYHSGGIPADMKFEIYDGKIIAILYIQREWSHKGGHIASHKADHMNILCYSILDKNWMPMDGMFKNNTPACNLPEIFPPEGHEAMLAKALKLAHGLGVYYRVDMFLTDKGVVLGEFTPWSNNGFFVEKLACRFLDFWRGDNNTRAIELASAATRPEVLRGWEALSTFEKCERVRMAQADFALSHNRRNNLRK